MAKLSKQPFYVEYTMEDGDLCRVKLRRATNEELDDMFDAIAEAEELEEKKERSRRRDKARVALFDATFLESENLFDESGAPITAGNVGEIPNVWKTAIVFGRYEQVRFAIKN